MKLNKKKLFLLKMSKHQLKFEINSNKTSFFFLKMPQNLKLTHNINKQKKTNKNKEQHKFFVIS